jgi:hypothetical protein
MRQLLHFHRGTGLVAVILALSACSNPLPPGTEALPKEVYLRGDDATVTVSIRVPASATVGRWYTLNATRETVGTWQRVPWSDDLREKDWLGWRFRPMRVHRSGAWETRIPEHGSPAFRRM